MKPIRRRSLILALVAAAAVAGTAAAVLVVTSGSAGSASDFALRTVNTSAGKMVVTGNGMTIYIYLPDQTRPSETTCTGDCANDWPPILSTTPNPRVAGIDKARIGLVTRPNGNRQLTLNGYPLYRFAADHRQGDIRGESVGNTWFAIEPDGNFLALQPVSFQPTRPPSGEPLQVLSTAIGPIVTDDYGQTIYTYRDDTSDSSACTPSWCTQDWPPLLVKKAPGPINGITGALGVLRRPDGTLQLTLDSHPLYRFSGDDRPGDLRGLGIGEDWYPIAPNGAKVGTFSASK